MFSFPSNENTYSAQKIIEFVEERLNQRKTLSPAISRERGVYGVAMSN
jgi:hypothetical protein